MDILTALENLDGARGDLLRYAQHLLANYEDAEDAVQTALLEAVTHCERYDTRRGERGVLAWVFGILENVCQQTRRKQARRCEEPLPEEAASDLWNAITETEAIKNIELRHEVRTRIRHVELTEMQRVCLQKYLAGRTVKQTAGDLNLSRQCVEFHLRRSAVKLRNAPLATDEASDDALYLFAVGKQVTVYRAPRKTGVGVAAQHLRALAAADRRAEGILTKSRMDQKVKS